MDIEYSIWLSGRPSCSEKFRLQLIQLFGSSKAVWQAQEKDYLAVMNVKRNQLDSLMQKGLEHTQRIMQDCRRHGIRAISIEDEDYPAPLRVLEDAPTVIYVLGTLPDWTTAVPIGIVGTRHATGYGLGASYWMGKNLAKAGCVIVSGMAEGIDSQASRGALDAGGKSIAVFGCGPDVCYPPNNKKLMDRIIQNGAVISEYPPGSEPAGWHFPRRNRIISGLSRGVLVIEAPLRSGSLITASMAAEQQKDVFAVPGNINSPKSMGTNQLIRNGAEMVTCAKEILSHYSSEIKYLRQLKNKEQRYNPKAIYKTDTAYKAESENNIEPPKPPEIFDKAEEIPKPEINSQAEEAPKPPIPTDEKLSVSLTHEEKIILRAVKDGAQNTDEVCDKTGLALQNVLASLTMLEINGLLHKVGSTIVLD